MFPCEVAFAERTASRCEASTPAACHSSPGRSGATMVTSEPVSRAAGAPSCGERRLVRAKRQRLGGHLPGQPRLHPPDQVADQAFLPVVPGGRAGRLAVRDGQCMQQLEQRPAADHGGHLGHGDRIVEIAARRRLRQQQMMPDRPGDQFRVRRAEPDPAGHVPGHHLTGDPVVTGPALADVVQQRGRAGAGRAGPRRG